LLNAWRDQTRLGEEFSRLHPRDGEALQRFIAYARTIYQAAADPFLYHSLGSPLTILDTFVRYILRGHDADSSVTETGADTFLSRCLAVGAALSPRTLDQQVAAFFQDPHLRQLFDRYATYNGSSPYKVGAVYSIIPYVELAGGGWYLRGGIYALAQALEKVALELGVTITTSSDVRRILVERGEARGIVLADGRIVRAKAVIANSDVVTTHRELLSPVVRNPHQMRRMTALEPSCSGFVLMLGVKGRYPQLAHHNIFFSDDYKAEFVELFEERVPLRNPTVYICASSRTDETQAPPDSENLFVLVNAPYLTEKSNWQQDAAPYREHILKLLSSYPQAGLEDLQERIVCEAMLTPKDFQRLYGANAGSIYGLSSNARVAPFTRPGNRSQTIRKLYFVGGSTHPGGGVPLVILSGKIVSELVFDDQA
jgi:phytoene desaturase